MRNLRRCLMLSSTWLQKRRKYCAADTTALITTSQRRMSPRGRSEGCRAPTITMATAQTCRTILVLPRVEAAIVKRSEEHTSELQSRLHLVCRLLLETKRILIILAIEFVRRRLGSWR